MHLQPPKEGREGKAAGGAGSSSEVDASDGKSNSQYITPHTHPYAPTQGRQLPRIHLQPPKEGGRGREKEGLGAAVKWMPQLGGPHGVLSIRADQISCDELIAGIVRQVRFLSLFMRACVKVAPTNNSPNQSHLASQAPPLSHFTPAHT